MSIFASKKTIMLQDLTTVHKYLESAAQARTKYSETWAVLAQNLQTMLAGQTTTISAQITDFTHLVKEIGEIHKRLSEHELRNSEDFRDIIERYEVMYRANLEYISAKEEFNSSSKNLDAARKRDEADQSKPDYEGKRKIKNENEIEKLKSQKARALDLVKEKLNKLIEEREKYNKFKVRRLCEGWSRYGHALKVESENESAAIDRIQECLQEMKAHNSFNPSDLQHIEKSLEEHINAAPAPEPTPVPVEEPVKAEPVSTPQTTNYYDEPVKTTSYYQPPPAEEPAPAATTSSNSTLNNEPEDTPYEGGSSSIEIPTKSPFDF